MSEQPPATKRAAPRRRNVGRVLGNIAVAIVILAVMAGAFALSYTPVRDIARDAGVASPVVRIYPGILDAVFLICCACALMLRNARWWTRLYAWLSVLVTGALIGAADVYHATGLRLPRRTLDGTVWALPWALVLLAFSLWISTLQHTKSDRDPRTPEPDDRTSEPDDRSALDARSWPSRPLRRRGWRCPLRRRRRTRLPRRRRSRRAAGRPGPEDWPKSASAAQPKRVRWPRPSRRRPSQRKPSRRRLSRPRPSRPPLNRPAEPAQAEPAQAEPAEAAKTAEPAEPARAEETAGAEQAVTTEAAEGVEKPAVAEAAPVVPEPPAAEEPVVGEAPVRLRRLLWLGSPQKPASLKRPSQPTIRRRLPRLWSHKRLGSPKSLKRSEFGRREGLERPQRLGWLRRLERP